MHAIFWHRRDLRIQDNTGLFHALKSGRQVIPIFIFDSEILTKLENKSDSRVTFIHDQLSRLKSEYEQYGSDLRVYTGNPIDVWQKLINEHQLIEVYTNHDYEPYAIQRDKTIKALLEKEGIKFQSFKDQVVFEKSEVVKDNGSPYTVFTPYSRKWKLKLEETGIEINEVEPLLENLARLDSKSMPSLNSIGFERSQTSFPELLVNQDLIKKYHVKRDIPSIRGTSRLSVHLRFGTVSIRKLVNIALVLNETWLNELIWREFYMMILFHFPKVVNHAFKEKYERIPWRNDEREFDAWCTGKTGYPIVDAGMRELNETGFMHNRVRMIVASFLTKHLLIDWRWGEAYFASRLNDYELSSNNGGWQWAAGTGCDAAPYFRVFNPYTQTEKFDKELKYVRKWVPELDDPSKYPEPIVEHKFARNRAIDTYKKALG